jgi:hypothetical protein
MAADFSRCSSRECHITGYDVTIEDNTGGVVKLTLADPCGTMSRACDAKAILIKGYRDWLVQVSATSDPSLATCVFNDKCPNGGPGMAYYHGSRELLVTTSETPPVAPLTATITLPISCDPVTFS